MRAQTDNALQPAYFSATNALYLITSNLSLGALVTHIALFHWSDIRPFVLSLDPWNKTEHLVHDAHWEKMKAYKQIPRWWYFIVLAVAYGIAQASKYRIILWYKVPLLTARQRTTLATRACHGGRSPCSS